MRVNFTASSGAGERAARRVAEAAQVRKHALGAHLDGPLSGSSSALLRRERRNPARMLGRGSLGAAPASSGGGGRRAPATGSEGEEERSRSARRRAFRKN